MIFGTEGALPRSQRDYLPPSRPLPQRDTLPLLLNPSRAPSLLLLLDSAYFSAFSILDGHTQRRGQRQRHLSKLPEASFAPQGEKATELTHSECPLRVLRLWPLATSQTMTVLREDGK